MWNSFVLLVGWTWFLGQPIKSRTCIGWYRLCYSHFLQTLHSCVRRKMMEEKEAVGFGSRPDDLWPKAAFLYIFKYSVASRKAASRKQGQHVWWWRRNSCREWKPKSDISNWSGQVWKRRLCASVKTLLLCLMTLKQRTWPLIDGSRLQNWTQRTDILTVASNNSARSYVPMPN
jgi:hypothetical protein